MNARALGFTIVELVVVLILLGILSATALSRFMSPSAFSPGSITTAIQAQGHYAAQHAQAGADDVSMRLMRNGGSWQIDVMRSGLNLRTIDVDVSNTRIDAANSGNVYEIIPANPLVITFSDDGELLSSTLGATVLDADSGIEVRVRGDTARLLCFYPTGYAGARGC